MVKIEIEIESVKIIFSVFKDAQYFQITSPYKKTTLLSKTLKLKCKWGQILWAAIDDMKGMSIVQVLGEQLYLWIDSSPKNLKPNIFV